MASSIALTSLTSVPALPLYYAYGGYPKVSTNISYGSPAQVAAIPTVVDLGSSDFWVFGPNSTINSGSNYFLLPGPCNQTPEPYYNNTASITATEPASETFSYSYGGNGKIVYAHFSVNDTLHFPGTVYPELADQQVAIANYTIVKQLAQTCTGALYEVSILGLSPVKPETALLPTLGPSFRQNLLDSGKIESPTLSMWFDEHTGSVKEDFKGTALFGAIPASKYSGPLVKFSANPPEGHYIGYYISAPVFRTAPLNDTSKSQEVPSPVGEYFEKPVRCLIDSGFGQDTLPISREDFIATTGLIISGGFPAFDGSCDDIPRNATLDFIFTNQSNQSVEVQVSLRNYARGNIDYRGGTACGLSMDLGGSDCYLGAPFFTGAFLSFNDDTNEIAVAQGGVSTGAELGPAGYGEGVIVAKGQGLPSW